MDSRGKGNSEEWGRELMKRRWRNNGRREMGEGGK